MFYVNHSTNSLHTYIQLYMFAKNYWQLKQRLNTIGKKVLERILFLYAGILSLSFSLPSSLEQQLLILPSLINKSLPQEVQDSLVSPGGADGVLIELSDSLSPDDGVADVVAEGGHENAPASRHIHQRARADPGEHHAHPTRRRKRGEGGKGADRGMLSMPAYS